MGDTRQQIISAADQLFYRNGYEATSFASIAEVVGISRGNFYHHFKTKGEILSAVIAARTQSTCEMISTWQAAGASPLDRVFSFIEIVITNQTAIEQYGCPVGSLTTELAKLGHPARAEAVQIFSLFRTWLVEQFRELGADADPGLGASADDLALHVLTFSQGVATLANAFGDRAYVRREVDRLQTSLRARFSEPTHHP